MGRHGYSDDCDDNWALIKWRGQVTSSIRGKRGQTFLRELVEALEAMPEKRLISGELQASTGEVCAIGSVGLKRGVNLRGLDPDDYETIAETFGITHQLVQEIEWQNDEGSCSWKETPEQRWARVHAWASSLLKTKESTVVSSEAE